MRVIIIGAGIGGLCLAHGLRTLGVDVAVFERAPSADAQSFGYGIHLDHDGMAALKACLPNALFTELDETASHAGAIARFFDTNLDLLASTTAMVPDGNGGEIASERRGIGRAELNRFLLTGLTDRNGKDIVHWGRFFERYQREPNGRVTAVFSDGSTASGDLLVGADGSNSRVRRQYLPHIERMNVGVTAIAGRYLLSPERVGSLPAVMLDGAPSMLVPSTPDWLFFSAWNACRPTGARGHVVWAYVAGADALPPNLDRLDGSTLRNLVLQRTQGWSDHARALVRGADTTSLSVIPLKSMPNLDPWPASAITVLGDAIHNMTPMAGIGANTALRDAANLAHSLSSVISHTSSLEDAVGRYEESMRHYANPAVRKSLQNARRAGSGRPAARWAFRTMLKASRTLPLARRLLFGAHAR
jgi:2-polyprenyl-6-methoxyphenol hydroxylase-like FAD-dependent oxidoreductase